MKVWRGLVGRPTSLGPTMLIVLVVVLGSAPALLASGMPVTYLGERCLHVVRFCFAALARIDSLLHAAPLLLLGAGLTRAVHRQSRLLRKGRVAVRSLPSRRPIRRERVHQIAADLGVLESVRVLVGPTPNPAFTAGLFRSRIYLSEVLERDLPLPELEAVLRHEVHHLRRRDPLRTLVLATLADVFFWLPMVREAASRSIARIEFAADDAARSVGDVVLAGAILRIAEISARPTGYTQAFASPPILGRRVERLLGVSSAERLPGPAWRTLSLSASALAMIWFLGVASSAAHAAHLPAAHEHCPHEHEHAVLHAAH